MEKAYDMMELGLRLKASGLVEAEDVAEKVYKDVKGWLKDSAKLSGTPFDNVMIPLLDQLDALILPEIDKIDGVPG